MSIASRIQAIEQHLTDDYNVLEVAGADLTNVNKNILNLKTTWQERLLYFMNNGTDVVWNNWDKVTGEGTTLTLNNTKEAPMKIDLKGNTSQATTTGKNLLPSIEKTNTQMETGVDYYGVTYFISVLPNTQYTLSCGDDTRGYQLREFTSDKEVIKTTGVVFGNAYTTTSTTRYIKFRTNNVVSSFTNTDFQFEKGSKTSYEPYTGGIPAPNPDFPEEVHVVSGDNEINVTGKNLLNYVDYLKTSSAGMTSFINSDGSITTTGKPTYNYANILLIDITPYLENGATYTMWQQTAQNNILYLQLTGTHRTTGAKTYQTLADTRKRVFVVDTVNYTYNVTLQVGTTSNWGDSSRTITNYYQLEKASNETSFEPYQGNTYPVNLPIENLFDKNNTNIFNGFTNTANHKLEANNNARTICFPCQSSTTYTISKTLSARFIVCETSSATISANIPTTTIEANPQAVSITGTTKSDTKYLLIFYYLSTADTLTENQIRDSIQIEVGNKANSYTPYGTTPIELCKIGNYQDYIYKDNGKWYLHKEIGKTVITSFNSKSGTSNNYMYSTSVVDNIKRPSGGTVVSSILATHGISKSPNTMYLNNTTGVGINTDGTIAVAFGLSSTLTTKELANTWVASNNITTYYPLATPTYTEITDSTLISQLEEIKEAQSYSGQTNISQVNNDKPFIINATALREME